MVLKIELNEIETKDACAYAKKQYGCQIEGVAENDCTKCSFWVGYYCQAEQIISDLKIGADTRTKVCWEEIIKLTVKGKNYNEPVPRKNPFGSRK
jgi:hypothetical protein